MSNFVSGRIEIINKLSVTNLKFSIMKHTLSIFFLFLCFICIALSQRQLKSELNLPRAGDDLMKEQIVYVEPGMSGENQIWDFTKIRIVDNAYIVHYFTRDDWKIVGAENGKLSFLKITGDSLLLCGYETPSILVKYSLRGLLLHFPIVYGAVSYGDFYGRGIHHNRLESIISGEIRTEADATGSLILPGGDTLTHVIRVHIRKTESARYLPVTSHFSFDNAVDKTFFSDIQPEIITTNTFQWYEEGYRYPVLETIESYRGNAADRIILRRDAYFYHPASQAYLPEDTANLVLLERKHAARNAKMPEQEGNILSFGCYPNPVKDYLHIDLTFRKYANVEAGLWDMQGHLVKRLPKRTHITHYMETVDVQTLPPGYYLVRVSSGDEMVSEKIVKN